MKKQILLVDDSPLVHQMYGAVLADAGFDVLHVDDGMSAINKVFLERPDLVLLDIHMPKINGYQVCRLLKDHPVTRHIPIIIMTGRGSSMVADPKTWSFETGANAFYDKDSGESLVGSLAPFLTESKPAVPPKHQTKPLSEVEILIALSQLLDKQLYKDVTRLKELDERKSVFVANVAHEFRSPLAVIGGNLDNLKDHILGDMNEKQERACNIALQTVKRLARLVSDMLDLAQIEAGKMALKKEEIDFQQVLAEVIEAYSVVIMEKAMVVRQEIAPHLGKIIGDRDRLTQVVINILSNSIKYTQEGGKVTLRLSKRDHWLRLEIEDNGPGMNHDHLHKIFNKFERLTAERKEGTGLGLPIAADIIKLHEGKIWVESQEGKGSNFIVELPCQA